MLTFVVICPVGLEDALRRELQAWGLAGVEQVRSGVRVRGSLADAYRACLFSRVATRVLVQIGAVAAGDPDALYAASRDVPWEEHLAPERTFAVTCTRTRAAIADGRFAALRVKDAIVDRMRERVGRRPDVDRRAPDVTVHLHLREDTGQLSVDLAGESLHRRGVRVQSVAAPLKENLAAGLLLLAGYGDAPGHLVDPMCGSGTFLIEAAWIAGDVAPGLLRERFGLEGWLGHDPDTWQRLRAEATERRAAGRARLAKLRIAGYDRDIRAVRAALANLEAAGLSGLVHVERRELRNMKPEPVGPTDSIPGWIATNPPYGSRLPDGAARDAVALLEAGLRRSAPGWRGLVLVPEREIQGLALDVRGRIPVRNGPLECQLITFDVPAGRGRAEAGAVRAADPDVDAFVGRLRKNLARLRKWIAREQVEAYRIYDADVPQIAFAIDRYGDRVHVQEYAPPATIDPDRAAARRAAVLEVLPELLGVAPEHVVLKTRARQRGDAQYQATGRRPEPFAVREGGLSFWVELTGHLDTGLFLDHRATRAMVRSRAHGARFLNLFAYTGSFTVYAAAGGARETTTVDLSANYLDVCARNLALNGLDGPRHRLVREDVRSFVARARAEGARFDLIFLDPPTFSTSKKMEGTWEVQRDHGELVRDVGALLAPGGTLLLAVHKRKFELDEAACAGLQVREITRQTIPPDFQLSARARRIHRVFELQRPTHEG